MFIYITGKKQIVNVDHIYSIKFPTTDTGYSDAKDLTMRIEYQPNAISTSIDVCIYYAIHDYVQNLEDSRRNFLLLGFCDFFLITLMKYIDHKKDIILNDGFIRSVYKSFLYQKYNMKRAKELSNLDSDTGIGKEIADCFIAREQDFQNEDSVTRKTSVPKSTDYDLHSMNMITNEQEVQNFFENERIFREEFEIPIDPNDKESIDYFVQQRTGITDTSHLE